MSIHKYKAHDKAKVNVCSKGLTHFLFQYFTKLQQLQDIRQSKDEKLNHK